MPEIRMARILPLERVKSKELSNIKNADYTGTCVLHAQLQVQVHLYTSEIMSTCL